MHLSRVRAEYHGTPDRKVTVNVLKPDRRRVVLSLLVEGCSIRAAERLTGVHRDTIMRLLIDAGAYCEGLLDNFCTTFRASVGFRLGRVERAVGRAPRRAAPVPP